MQKHRTSTVVLIPPVLYHAFVVVVVVCNVFLKFLMGWRKIFSTLWFVNFFYVPSVLMFWGLGFFGHHFLWLWGFRWVKVGWKRCEFWIPTCSCFQISVWRNLRFSKNYLVHLDQFCYFQKNLLCHC